MYHLKGNQLELLLDNVVTLRDYLVLVSCQGWLGLQTHHHGVQLAVLVEEHSVDVHGDEGEGKADESHAALSKQADPVCQGLEELASEGVHVDQASHEDLAHTLELLTVSQSLFVISKELQAVKVHKRLWLLVLEVLIPILLALEAE